MFPPNNIGVHAAVYMAHHSFQYAGDRGPPFFAMIEYHISTQKASTIFAFLTKSAEYLPFRIQNFPAAYTGKVRCEVRQVSFNGLFQ